eukprot:765525-Hanusia_phi.AAC.1
MEAGGRPGIQSSRLSRALPPAQTRFPARPESRIGSSRRTPGRPGPPAGSCHAVSRCATHGTVPRCHAAGVPGPGPPRSDRTVSVVLQGFESSYASCRDSVRLDS